MRAIKLYGTAAATANNVANVTIPSSTRILAVQFSFDLDTSSDNGRAVVEISQASASEIGVNGAQQCIAEFRLWQNLVTSGVMNGSTNGFVQTDVTVKQGQIIYMHCLVATGTFYFTGILWLRD